MGQKSISRPHRLHHGSSTTAQTLINEKTGSKMPRSVCRCWTKSPSSGVLILLRSFSLFQQLRQNIITTLQSESPTVGSSSAHHLSITSLDKTNWVSGPVTQLTLIPHQDDGLVYRRCTQQVRQRPAEASRIGLLNPLMDGGVSLTGTF